MCPSEAFSLPASASLMAPWSVNQLSAFFLAGGSDICTYLLKMIYDLGIYKIPSISHQLSTRWGLKKPVENWRFDVVCCFVMQRFL